MMDFEEEREANIARNRALLQEFALGSEFMTVKKPQPKQKAQKKRKEVPSDSEDDEAERPPRKAAAVVSVDSDASAGPRRSGRNADKKVDYTGDGDKLQRNDGPRLLTKRAMEQESAEKTKMKRIHNPKVFGSIPGIEVGKWWETREACSMDAIHAPWVAGIAGNQDKGCYSVALSGGYEDDVDLGNAFTYTGSGGRDLKGTKNKPKNLRTAPQSSDQTFENRDNKALLKSVETRKPVRVIRGYKLRSKFAPIEGYRYDGLYTVEKAWMEKGLNPKGYKVCKFVFKRVPGQPPLPVYEDDEENATAAEGATDDAEAQSTDAEASAEDTLVESEA